MKAIRIHEHGNLHKLLVDEIAMPQIKPDEILVKIKFSALNHLDLWVRKGLPGVPLPLIMGSDAAGVVVECGAESSAFKTGDEVIIAPIDSCGKCKQCMAGYENMCASFGIPGESAQGVQAQYIAVKERYLLPKPANINWEQAASFSLAAITAYHMLDKKAHLKRGEVVLIYGASSGVGSSAIQIAKARGAKVITTVANEAKEAFAKKLGADYVINYQKEDIIKRVKNITKGTGVDVVFEHTGLETWEASLRSLKKGGKLITCGATTGSHVKIDLRALFIKHQQLIGSTMGGLKDLTAVIQLIETGTFIPQVSKVFYFEDVQKAHQLLEDGLQSGKVALAF
jgi:2-desacetyl-2-hydroxyethyl bacteriochlorophyllide A dehydrogenase